MKLKQIIEKEKKQDKRLNEKQRNHKCYGCDWSKWHGNKYYCPFVDCIRNCESETGRSERNAE